MMKYLGFLASLLFIFSAQAQYITIENVKVSITPEAGANPREQALDKGYDLAFQKLLEEAVPSHPSSSPSHQEILDMVADFSIEREKSSSKGYTVLLTFKFNSSKVQEWLQKKSPSKESPLSQKADKGQAIKIMAHYQSFPEWIQMKQSLLLCSGVQKIIPISISSNQSELEVSYNGHLDQLKGQLLKTKLLLAPSESGWTLIANK